MQSDATPRLTAPARDAALRRLRGFQKLVLVAALALAAGFAVLAQAATPPYQKHRATEVTLAAPARHGTHHARRHRRHHRHHHAAAAAPSSAPAPSAPSSAPAAPAPAPVPAPAAPAPVQPAPAPAPAPTQRPPAATSGGS
jgi:hypothetical protein